MDSKQPTTFPPSDEGDQEQQPVNLGGDRPSQHKDKQSKKGLIIALIVAVVLVVAGVAAWALFFNKKETAKKTTTAESTKPVTLVYMVHWMEDQQINGIKDKDGKLVSKGLQQYLDEYKSLHKNVSFTLKQTHVSKYNDELQTMVNSGAAPDLYQVYSTWGPSYVRAGALDQPSGELLSDIKSNYVSTAGATIEGKVYGIPTEINNYALLYNKNLFKQAGIVDAAGNAKPPTTWQEFVQDAQRLTKRGTNGAITQYGTTFMRDTDWTTVDPFLSLLFSNGGDYLSSDLKRAVFNSPAGVAALNAQTQLFRDKSTDALGQFFDFKDGKVGMVIAPPWTKSTFATSFGANFQTTVGVAPFPYMNRPSTLQYSWFTGVMKDSIHKKEAWDFLKWFTTETQASGTTRYGDLLANTIGAIPARKVDFNKHKDVLGDFFTSVYVNQMKDSKAEPNVMQASAIKNALMAEIQAAWDGTKTSQQALDAAAANVNTILQQYYK